MKHLLYTLLLGVFLTSCYRKIDLDEYRTTPKMVINSVVSPDTVVMYNPQIEMFARFKMKSSFHKTKRII